MRTLTIVFLMMIFSCNNSQNKADADSTVTKIEPAKAVNNTIANTVISDSIIHIRFPKDSTSATVYVKMKGISSPVTVYIPVKQGSQLTGRIAPDDSIANIRFNQIFSPSGKADGPFGREIRYGIKEQGTYKLIIAENMMQGDEWKGKFHLTVSVK